MSERRESSEQLGPEDRLRVELARVQSRERIERLLAACAILALIVAAVALAVPFRMWAQTEAEMRVSPRFFFVAVMAVMAFIFYMIRRDLEVQKLRLLTVQQSIEARADRSASMIDSVTNVFSRSFLRGLLQGEIAQAERNNRPLALMMCDLDDFRQVNDRFGHLVGDAVLAQIAGVLKGCIRGSDFIVRYGGDEFLLVLPETDGEGAEVVRNRIERKIAEWAGGNRLLTVPIGVSLGIHHHRNGQSPEEDIAAADASMYAARRKPVSIDAGKST